MNDVAFYYILNDFFFIIHRSADFNNFVAKCLVKDPTQRLSSTDLLQVSVKLVQLSCSLT